MRDKKRNKKILIGLIGLLLLMSAGYAAFSSNLNISGTSNITSNWDIRITNVTSGDVTGSAENTKAPTWDNLTASMEADLYEKGDSVEYTVTIANKGTLDAKLEDIVKNNVSSNDAVKITFSGYTKGQKLYKNTSQDIKVKIEYNPDYKGDASEGSGEINVTFNYTQAEGGTITPTNDYLLTYDYSTNGGTTASQIDEYYTEESSVNLSVTAEKEGWEFIGWNTNKDSEVALKTFAMPSENTTLFALYSKNLKITYTKDEYTSSIAKENDNCNIYNNQTGCEITLPEITSANTILGWYEGDNKVGTSKDKYTLTKDTTLIAKSEEPEPIMMARDTSKAFWQSDYNSKISTVDILTNKDVPSDAVESWDVSEKQNKSVMAWIVDDSENEGMYKLYIGGKGGVIAPANSYYLFSGYGSSSTNYGTFYKTTSMNLANLDTSRITNMSYMFSYCSSLTSLDVSNFDTSKVTNMSAMFFSCSSLTSLDVSKFDTSKVTTMSSMFNNCSNLTSLDVSNFDTSKVTDMESMFKGCSSLTSLDVSNFNTSKVTDMYRMFSYCSSLTSLDLSSFDTSNVTDMYGMFSDCSSLTSLNVSNFDTSKVTHMREMFSRCSSLTKLNLCSFDTSKVKNMNFMFYGTAALKYVYVGPNWTTESATTIEMFNESGVSEVTQSDNCEVDAEEISVSFNTTSTTNSIIVVASASAESGIAKYEYSKDGGSTWITGTGNTYTFTGLTQGTNYNIKARVTSKVGQTVTSDSKTVSTLSVDKPTFSESGTTSKIVKITYPSGCGSTYTCTYSKDGGSDVKVTSTTASVTFTADGTLVAKVSDGINIVSSSYNVSIKSEPIMMANAKGYAFWQSDYKSKISTVNILTNKDVPDNAVESWDVSEQQNGTVMAYIIDDSENEGMYKLYIGGEDGVIAPSKSNSLFMGFSNATSMNLSNLDTNGVITMASMFNGCSSLISLDVSNFDTSNVTKMASMFNNCSSLTSLDLSNFDTSKVTTMSTMFTNCSSLTKLSLCSFDTSNVTNMTNMFNGTAALKYVYVGPNWTTESATTTGMFSESGVSEVTQSDNCK